MATEILRPNAVGDESNLDDSPSSGDSYADVDEASPDDDSTYVYDNGGTLTFDSYGLQATALTSETVDSVDGWSRGRNSNGTGQIAWGVRLSGSNSMSATTNMGTSYTDREEAALARPGGGVWAVADLDGLQARVGLDRGSGASARCTQLWVEVNYTASQSNAARSGYYHSMGLR